VFTFNDNLDLRVCGDCYFAVANGTDGMDLTPERESDILAGLEAWGEEGYVLANNDPDTGESRYGFCWDSECAVCHTSLGGERHGVVAIPR
jgi:mono/diheme cytochrome c family protein